MYVDTKEAISVTLSPSLRNLAYILRHKEMWPKGFEWDYTHFDNCAMGMCSELWNERSVYSLVDTDSSFDTESMWDIEKKIFIRPVSFFKHPFTGVKGRMAMVTPEIVADRIDAYLDATK